jgi:polyisoprenoid-binding protein YceI
MVKWIIDSDHSVAGFCVRHFMIANVRGQFNNIKGMIQFDPADIAHSSVQAVIDVSGIYTGIKKRDDHLLSPDFFDVAKCPEIIFISVKVESAGGNRFRVTGDLTMRGITRPVVLEAEYFGPIKSPYGETSIGFSAATRINREDYGINWNEAMESGGFIVGKDVEITVDVEADLGD